MIPPLRIAIIGQRGVPATMGGIEHHVEELGARLAARGHDVTVYCRTNYVTDRAPVYRGMRLRYLPTVGTKRLDCIAHSGLSTVVALARAPDIIHYQAIGPALMTPIPRVLSRAKVVVTVHSLDYARNKWGAGARAVLRLGAWLSARVPHATITVSQAIADYYAARYHRRVDHIPNGVPEPVQRLPHEILRRFGLHGHDYLLFVGRLVPEKAPDLLLRAFRRMPDDVRLVITGSSGFTDGYVRALTDLGRDDPRVAFTGAVHGSTLDELYSNAIAFVLPSNLEGMPITLLEAASHGTPVVASDIPPHLEILREDGPGHRIFRHGDEDSLVQALAIVLRNGGEEVAGARQLRDAVLTTYSWEDVTTATERVYERVLG